MSKKPYDFLATEKEPFLYIEKAIIRIKDGFLIILKGKDGIEIIAPASLLFLMLGVGTSITNEAAIYCAKNDVFVCFCRGGSNIHSIWMSGRFQNPESLRNQIRKTDFYHLDYAKTLLKYRLKLLNQLDEETKENINNLTSVENILLFEARWAKKVYRFHAQKYHLEFSRKFDGIDHVNERLNILNNALYSLCSAICYATSVSPSIAIIHGDTRRGGLAFDLADLVKTQTIFDLSFNPIQIKTNLLMHKFANNLKQDNQKLLKLLISVCLSLADKDEKLMELLKT